MREPVYLIFLAVLSLVVLFLGKSLQETRSELQRESFLAQGDYVPPLELTQPDGQTVSLGYPQPDTTQVVILFGPNCRYCDESVEAWEILSSAVSASSRASLFGLTVGSKEAAERFLSGHGLDLPLLLARNPPTVSILNGRVVPQVIVFGPGGRVEASYKGPIEKGDLERVSSILHAAGIDWMPNPRQ